MDYRMIGAIIQARMNSRRLPGKVLLPLPFGGQTTVLENIIRRVRLSSKIQKIVVATSTNSSDDAIAALADKNSTDVFRGEEQDVLHRYYTAAQKFSFDTVVRICGDCPCIDYTLIDDVISAHNNSKADYTSNLIGTTFPLGVNVEVASFSTIARLWQTAHLDYEREHVFTHITHTNPGGFHIETVTSPIDYRSFGLRLTLDTESDYVFLCTLFDYLYEKNQQFLLSDVVQLLKEKPWMTKINAQTSQKKVYTSLREEITAVLPLLDTGGFQRIKEKLKRMKT